MRASSRHSSISRKVRIHKFKPIHKAERERTGREMRLYILSAPATRPEVITSATNWRPIVQMLAHIGDILNPPLHVSGALDPLKATEAWD